MYVTKIKNMWPDDAYASHKGVMLLHDQHGKQGRVLFQVQGDTILVLSPVQTTGSICVQDILDATGPSDSMAFTLRVSPLVTRFINGKNRRVTRERDGIREWLNTTFENNGFTSSASFYVEPSVQVSKGERGFSFPSLLVAGVLTVQDHDLFKKALISGIGHGKAFGFGLIDVY